MRMFDLNINGETRSVEKRVIRSPFNEAAVGQVPQAGPEEIEAATETAVAAASKMAALPRHARIKALHDMAHSILRRQEELAKIICDEAGKPMVYAEGEAARAAQTFMAAADVLKTQGGEVIPVDSVPHGGGRTGLVRRAPLGALVGISPFNFPLNLSAHKVAPAIAAGCSMVLKPASQTPMSAMMLGALARDVGLPDGALTVVPAHRTAADRLIPDARFKLLTFTGSAEVGWGMKSRAGKKKVALELGGNAAAVVGADADLDSVVPKLVTGAFAYAGQVCISVQRIFVMAPLFDDFLEQFTAATAAMARVGDPRDPEVMVGPMIDAANLERVERWVQRARDGGAQVLCGGKPQGTCYLPTVITGADPALQVVAEEAFAPLVVVEKVADWDEAITRVNDSDFGLQCAVFTNELSALWSCFEQIEVGGVIHNDSSLFRVDHMPYGGVKDSGQGREGPRYAYEEMTEPRLLVLNPNP